MVYIIIYIYVNMYIYIYIYLLYIYMIALGLPVKTFEGQSEIRSSKEAKSTVRRPKGGQNAEQNMDW